MQKVQPLYYHAIELKHLKHDVIYPDPVFAEDDMLLPCYRWMAEQVKFYPLWLAVGDDSSAYMCGYDNNWRRWIGTNMYRKKGEFPNIALLVFREEDLPVGGIYSDYQYWHIIMNDVMNGWTPSAQTLSWVFKPSYTAQRWRRYSLSESQRVQIVVPYLDLRKAAQVWVRNQESYRYAKALGFDNVIVKRIAV